MDVKLCGLFDFLVCVCFWFCGYVWYVDFVVNLDGNVDFCVF